MTIIVFLIDTSASMNQRVYLGGRPTLLDVAKGAVETFVKVRQRHPESRVDRYMLLTFEEPPNNIKAGWKENIATFMNELKNLSCVGMTTMGAALKQAFDVLNINRMQSGIDTYGQGRSPFYLEPSVIVVITDGGKLSNNREVQEEFNLPMHSPIPGSELTREPFRWDQRLFSLVLRLTGTPAVEREGMVASDTSPIDAMCEVTGGRSYCITSQRVMHQCIESLVQKVQSGVVINFEKIGPDPMPISDKSDGDLMDSDSQDKEKDCIVVCDEDGNSRNGVRTNGSLQGITNCPWHQCRRLIYVQRQSQKGGFAIGYWPIPESFWPDSGASTLPARSAHPNLKFTCTSQEPMVIENLPFDKYELEPSPLTQYILARKQNTTCWQVFVMNSYKNSDVGHPFGYLKASTNLSCVNLFVMPYNYPVLLPLLDELFKIHRCKPTNEWRTQWQNYLRTMPAYYAVPLRRALLRMAAPTTLAHTLIPESMDNSLSYTVMTYLKRLKVQAKVEFDRMCNEVINKPQKGAQPSGVEGIRVVSRSQFKKDLVTHPQLQDKFISMREQLNDYTSFMVGVLRSTRGQQCYKNAFDIPRRSLLDQVIRMRSNFLQQSHAHTKLLDDDYIHSMPIAQMGNYQEYLKRQQPQLREIESAPVRQHMFGNPFKIDKRMMVDEADIDLVGGSTGQSGASSGGSTTTRQATKRPSTEPMSPRLPNKRKPGPLPKDTVARRPISSISPRPDSPLPVFPTFLNSGPSIPDGYLSSPGSSPPASPAPEVEEDAPCLPVRLVNGDLGERRGERTVLVARRTHSSRAPLAGYPDVPGRPRSPSPPPPPTLQPQPPPLDTPPPPMENHPYAPAILIHNNHLPEMRISPPLVNHVEPAEVKPNHLPYEPTTPAPPPPPPPPPPTPPPPPPTAEELIQMRKHNLNVRDKIYQEIRRPGRNFTALFKHLQFIQGPLEMKQKIVKDAIRESGRFKRKTLSDKLEEFLQTLSTNNITNSPLNNHVTRSKSKSSLQATRTS